MSNWVNDAHPDLSQDERLIEAKSLASLSAIMRYGSQYWGGVAAWFVVAALLVALVYFVTNETIWQACVNWIVAFKNHDADSKVYLYTPVAILAAGGLAYWVALKKFKHEFIRAWGLTVLAFVLATMIVKLNVTLAGWSKDFYDAIQAKDYAAFVAQCWIFAQLATLWVLVNTYNTFYRQMLQIRWRTWLTERLSNQYLLSGRFYFLTHVRSQENPDQRISEDLNRITTLAVSLFFGAYIAILSVYEFSVLMLKISGDWTFEAFGSSYTVPYYMFWAAVLYAIFGSFLVHFVGRRLIKLNFLSERYNADFRYHLIRAREYGEGITFLKGEANHAQGARDLFAIIRSNWHLRMWRNKLLGFTSFSYNQASALFPYVVAAPRYFTEKGLSLGDFMQIGRTFGELHESLSWFVNSYDTITELRASASRVFLLESALARVDEFKAQSALNIDSNHVGGVALTHVSLNRPEFDAAGQLHEKAQVLGLDWQIHKGQRWLVTGASGSGKSTILRSIAALWPFGKGQIDVPQQGKIQFLPQRPYFPLGSLREALAYPAAPSQYQDMAYEAVLEMTQLSHLKARLAESGNWGQMLSGGEQQRLAFARVFLQRPDYVFLDEATASLDEANEANLYATLLSFLPNITLVSVSHHPQLAAYHDHELHLLADELGGFKAKAHAL
ncbi:MAG: ABC transporter ATP-binding protein/permease [Formosimonas sp.]